MFHTDIKLLRSFALVATEHSVTRAAERLGLTQPTVTGQIKDLERAMGFSLFHRTTRRIDLTEQGERLLPMVQRLLDEANRLRSEVEEMQAADAVAFRLGAAMYTLDFPDRLDLFDAFAAERPNLRYVVDNRLQCEQVVDLLNERLDVALLLGSPGRMATSEQTVKALNAGLIANETIYPDHLERVVLQRRRIGLIVPEQNPLARFASIPPKALAGEQIAMLSLEHGEELIRPISEFFEAAGAVQLFLEEGNALAVERHAARRGICAMGVGWFPLQPGMVFRPVDGMAFALDLAVVLGASPNKAARRFFNFVSAWQAARMVSLKDGPGASPGAADRGERVPVGARRAVTLE